MPPHRVSLVLAVALAPFACAPTTADPLPEPRPPAAVTASSASAPSSSAAASASAAAPGGAPPASARAPRAPAGATRATPIGAGETAVVWTRRARPGPAGAEILTHFVRADGSVAATRAGIFVADGDRLWRWRIEKKASPGERCEPPQINPMGARKLERATLVPTRGGAAIVTRVGSPPSIEIAPFATSANEYDLPAEEHHDLVASWGAYVFTRSDDVIFPCGMHPGYAASFAAFELDAAGALQPVALETLTGDAGALLDEAKRRFDKDAQGDATGSSLDGVAARDGIKPTMAFPAFGAAGVVWTVQLTADASWAGSYGGWSGYTRSVQVPAPQPPPRLAGGRLPAPALAFAAAHPELSIGGVGITTAPVP